MHVPHLSWTAFSAAAVALVLPQLPLSFANSCLATADTARAYFGDAARRVRPGRLAITLGLANLFAGAISGMPVCHGAGGMTAHRSFGARSGGAPIMLGSVLIALALAIGATLTAALAGFPVPILAGLLTVAGLLHIMLLKDLRGPWHWALALAVGITGFLSNLAVALVGALVIWWLARLIQARRSRLLRVVFAGDLVQRMVQHVGEHPKAVAHPARRTRQVDHQGPPGHPAYAAGKHRGRHLR